MKVSKKLAQYTSVATAACAGGGISTAEAQLTSFSPNLNFNSTGTDAFIWDISAGTFGTTNNFYDYAMRFRITSTSGNPFVTVDVKGDLTRLAKVGVSDSVGTKDGDIEPDDTRAFFYGPGAITPAGTAYVGFSFDTGGIFYGWAEITNINTTAGFSSATLANVYWEQTAFESLHVGTIPEASTGLLCLAAGSIVGFRRRRKAA